MLRCSASQCPEKHPGGHQLRRNDAHSFEIHGLYPSLLASARSRIRLILFALQYRKPCLGNSMLHVIRLETMASVKSAMDLSKSAFPSPRKPQAAAPTRPPTARGGRSLGFLGLGKANFDRIHRRLERKPSVSSRIALKRALAEARLTVCRAKTTKQNDGPG